MQTAFSADFRSIFHGLVWGDGEPRNKFQTYLVDYFEIDYLVDLDSSVLHVNLHLALPARAAHRRVHAHGVLVLVSETSHLPARPAAVVSAHLQVPVV